VIQLLRQSILCVDDSGESINFNKGNSARRP